MHLRYRVPSIYMIMLALALFLGVLLSFTNAAFADTAVVSSDIINIRTGPGTGYSIITQAGSGDRLPILEKSGDWYSVSLATGQKGWLAGWLVSIEQSQPQSQPQTSQNTSQTAKVNGSSVNIRSGPGTSYSILAQVGSGAALPILGSSGDWYKVSINSGGSGWIAGWLVSVVTSPAQVPSRSDTTGARNAVVTGSTVNVRGGPGTANSIISQVFQGDSLSVLEQSGDWYRVKLANGSSGWVAGWLVSMQTSPANPPSNQDSSGGTPPDSSGSTDSQAARGISLSASDQGDKTRTVITANAAFDYIQSFLTNPDRLVIDLKGIAIGDLPAVTNVDSESVSQIRTGYFQKNPDITRVVFDLKGGAQYDVSLSGDNKTLTVNTYIPDIKNAYSGKIIAIDPGHGGPDPGAVGKMGTKEKDINLDIARRVAKLLEAKGAKVIMTRTTETSEVGLYQRTSKANAGKANLFVSIHINANDNASLGGTSTYVYSGTATARVKESDRLARYIQSELVKTLGLRDIGVKYADFAVLRTSTMPAVLCELAFISNIPEEKYMNTDGFKNAAAEAIVKGIGIYFSERRNA